MIVNDSLEQSAVLAHASFLDFFLAQLLAVHGHVRLLLLLLGKVHDLLLDAIFHDQSEDLYRTGLTKTVNTVDCLSDGSWVVLRFHDENPRRRGQIQAHTTGTDGC